MEYIEKIKKMLCKELDEYAMKQKISGTDLEMIWKLTDTVKNLGKIEMLEEQSGGSSEARGGRGRGGSSSYRGGSSSYYGDDDEMMMYSEARGRGRNARRDSMGRYASEDGGSSSYEMGGSSYARGGQGGGRGGYSRGDAKEHIMDKLGMMMQDADPEQREALKKCMREIERA